MGTSQAPDDRPWLLLLLFIIGFAELISVSTAILKWVFAHFLRPAKNLKKYGSWALVTGPTDGIGEAFAFRLAREGLNLVLVGRNPEKLRTVSDRIRAKFNGSTRIKTVAVDFAGDLDDGVRRIREAIDGLDVGVLVNNVGATYPYARFFHEVDEELMRAVIRVNVEGTTRVTLQAVLPGMVARRRGAVVNIGSGTAGAIPSAPLHTLYSATKAYIDQFSRSLHREYKTHGIHVQCQVPLYVATKMISAQRPSFFIPSPDDYAAAAMRWIGHGDERCTPYWPHSLQWALLSFLPHSIVDAFRFNACLRIRAEGRRKEMELQLMTRLKPGTYDSGKRSGKARRLEDNKVVDIITHTRNVLCE